MWIECFPGQLEQINSVNIYLFLFIFFHFINFLTDNLQNNIWRTLWQILPVYIETNKNLSEKYQEIAKLQFLVDQKHIYDKQKHHIRNLKKEFVSIIYNI